MTTKAELIEKIKQLKVGIDGFITIRDEAYATILQLKQDIHAVSEKVKTYQEVNSILRSEIEQLTQERDALKSALEGSEAENDELQKRLDHERSDYSCLVKLAVEYWGQRDEARTFAYRQWVRVEKLQHDNQMLLRAKDELLAERAELRRTIYDLTHVLDWRELIKTWPGYDRMMEILRK